ACKDRQLAPGSNISITSQRFDGHQTCSRPLTTNARLPYLAQQKLLKTLSRGLGPLFGRQAARNKPPCLFPPKQREGLAGCLGYVKLPTLLPLELVTSRPPKGPSMEGYLPTGVPVQRRLSRLYNDTKKSSDFVKEPVSNGDDPEIRALHRKLRIQKDRLVSWGLEWSDNSQSQSAEVLIDKSLSKAGLSEVVGSIMSTIKDILAEAEPLWQSSRRLIGERESEKKGSSSGDHKNMPMVPWDKGRFEDLVRDLTTSIDTLFDLSRTRSTTATSQSYKQSGSSDEMRAFESTRVQTPKQIDPNTLTNLRAMQAEPMSEGASEEARPREIVFMQRQAYSEIVPQGGSGTGRQPNAPLLLEYAAFDPIYSTTGIMPSMTRFEKLSAGLQSDTQRPGTWIGLPRLLGYFEDYEHSRLGLVYQFPPTFNPISYENLTQNPLYSLNSLSDLLKRPDFEPKLEAKFRLASNLANTVFDMHARGISHGNLIDTNISFCNAVGNDPSMNTADVDIRRPLVSSFDLFPDSPFPETSATSFSLYRHPLDPRVTSASTVSGTASANADPRVFDLYSLSMILLSVGLWTNLELLTPNPATTEIPSSVLEQLAIRCGTLYMKAVQACWTAADKELSGQAQGASDQLISKVQVKASRYLEACCILDGVSALEDRLTDDLGEPKAVPAPVAPAGSSKGAMERKSAKSAELYPISEQQQPSLGPPMSGFTQTTPVVIEDHPLPVEAQVRPRKSPRARLYPHVPLPAELVEQWNLTLMPEINLALQHFYKKHPESVEISLESIGESAKETRPTVLVVCTSVAKVRGILKKRLGYLFDGTTDVALKVCKGQMLRSRKTPTNSSLQHGPPVDAANGEFQERPGNGASIGAWIGNQHLPPASLGGIVIVDDKPYGMTVHHMLDDPDAGLGESTATQAQIDQVQDILRSSAGAAQQKKQQQEISDLNASLSQWYADLQADAAEAGSSSTESEYACEFSDTGSEASGLTSDYSESDWGGGGGEGDDSDEEKEKEDEYGEPGDIPGVELGCGEGYIITQPAFDDVGEGFYPNEETADEDHLDTCALGEVHASSGIRRRTDEKGLVHEIDWALIEFDDHRTHQSNFIPSTGVETAGGIRPTTVLAASALPGLDVQCIARTSGLQSGRILPTIVSVKIYGRQTASHSYQISSTPSLQRLRTSMHRPMGIPGDSGAWIVERGGSGRLCGHVLAWSDRKRVAYLCPMDMLLLDMAETLEAAEVRLPGGDVIVKAMSPEERKRRKLEGTMGPSKGFALMIEQPQSPLVARQSSLRQQDIQRQRWSQVMDMKQQTQQFSQQKPIARANTGFTVDDDDVSSVSTAGGHPNPMHMAFKDPVNVPPLTPLEIRSARHFRDSGVHDTSASPDKTEIMDAGLRRDGSVRSSGRQAGQGVDPYPAGRFGDMNVDRGSKEDARFYAR
ncbi:hypothetical protein PspLS_09340, partial [Pyricularia sp. CBS 133598]